ncbi:GIY-YIG nuclease family protein [Halorubrum halophilum]|uniref:GIY-YIG nuclease family protein n=1 Tax=Halorubrum halophilum TaxID=413816 RepID=UPI00186ABF4F|nr:GIY-YIG nuclease family protein [Halorubrum halophilum]
MIENFYARDWCGMDWSEWKLLYADSFSEIPKEPGLYRVRHRNDERPFLEYIGESGDTRRRIQALARGTYADEMPYRDPHTAAPSLWAIRDAVGPELEVSCVTPSKAENDQHRKGIEAALIALHRRETNQSPTANFGRIIEGYKQSSYSYNEPAYKGGCLDDGETEANAEEGIEPTKWKNSTEPRAQDWMGLDWSEPYYLQNRLDANPPDNGLYRIWYDDASVPLAYVGESSNISSRLYNHEKTFGGHAQFSWVALSHLDTHHKRTEIETELIGAYYLTEQESPLAQFGYEEKLDRDGLR